MTITVYGALLGWPVIVLVIFALMPGPRAAAIAVIGAWLFLPPAQLSIVGLPDYSKNTAATVGVILATIIFCPDRLLKFRLRWFDLPMLLFCLTGIVTSLQNGLGLYDGLSDALNQTVVWGMPYFFGRLYFGDPESLRQMTTAMAAGGLCYVPLCHFEMRLMTSLQMRIYSLGQWASGSGLRMGGYRPNVFFHTGLELGLWMTAASMSGWWLWRCGVLKKIGQVPFGSILLPILMVTTILCRSTGAIILLAIGMLLLWLSARFRTRLFLVGLLLVGPVYAGLRASNLWSGEQAVKLATDLVGSERAGSLEYRFKCENLLAIRALQQPVFGWGGWNRSEVRLESGKHVDTDGLWMIFLGTRGLVGLTLFYLALTLPAMIFIRRFPVSLWADPRVAAASLTVVLLGLYMIDCLLNGFVNIVYLTLAGGLITMEPKQLAATAAGSAIGTVTGAGKMARADHDYKLGRIQKAEGRLEEALALWQHALNLLNELTTAHPDSLDLQRKWCDCANDLAWLLANAPDTAIRNPPYSVALAVKAMEYRPDCATYRNTLGAAYYRTGNSQAAVAALDRAIALNQGGTAFDHVFLAMAYGRLGNLDEARRWFALAKTGMEQSWPDHVELHCLCNEAEAIVLTVSVVSPKVGVS